MNKTRKARLLFCVGGLLTLAVASFGLGWALAPDNAHLYRYGESDGYAIGYNDALNGVAPAESSQNRFMIDADYERRYIIGGRPIGE